MKVRARELDQKAASTAPPTPRPSASFTACPAALAIDAADESPLGFGAGEAPGAAAVMATFCPWLQCDAAAHAKYLVPALSNVTAVLPLWSDDAELSKLHAL